MDLTNYRKNGAMKQMTTSLGEYKHLIQVNMPLVNELYAIFTK